MKPIVTEEDKRLVGYLSKKNKNKKIHVYFNRKKANGKTNYLSGKHYSPKNKKEFVYRSSYELKFFLMLDLDPKVKSYEVESLKIPYRDINGVSRNYIPDVIVLYKTGRLEVCEVKPNAMLDDITVKLKAQACKTYFNTMFKDRDINHSYRFITEDDLFTNATEYAMFLKDNS